MTDELSDITEWRVGGRDGGWTLGHDLTRVTGPGPLVIGGETLWYDTVCRIGDLSDELSLVKSARPTHKADATVVESEGYLPFGSQPGFRHRSIFGDRLVRVTTDLRLPARTVLDRPVEIGTLTLASGWEAVRTVTRGPNGMLVPGEWEALGAAGREWPQAPLALVLRHGSGAELELGTGNDLWRWQSGITPCKEPGRFALLPLADGRWQFRRMVNVITTSVTPEHKSYRFSWYAAWRTGATLAPTLPQRRTPATWQGMERLETRPLDGLTADDCLVLDMGMSGWPASQLRGDGLPCVTSHGVTRRLRQAVRQIQAFPNRSFGVLFANLVPGCCSKGSHLDRPRELPHWDMLAILEFGAWARHTLGPERCLWHEGGALGLPSLDAIFANEAEDV